MKDHLIWKEEGRKTVFDCSVFKVGERYCRSPENELNTYIVLDTSDWVIVVPVLETANGKEFVMVRQWRHGACELSMEFPGGVFEKNEDAATAAARELREETGYSSGKLEKLGVFNPNPAIMSNNVHFFLARDLGAPSKQDLDEDEYMEVEIIQCDKAMKGMGKSPYIHALTGTAMALYLQKIREEPDS